jgi:hypothetical protein
LNHRYAVGALIAATLVIVGVGDLTPGITPWFGFQTAEAVSAGEQGDNGEDRRGPIVWDVAIDSRTFRHNGGLSPDEFGRGDTFIANGKIFPGGTIPSGNPGNHPDDPGSIGTWVERGTWAATRAEIAAGTRPAFFATFFHFLDDGSRLVAEGPHPESNPLAVVGGTGGFSGAGGELYDEILGRNSTGSVNLRLTIYLKKQAPK